MTLSEKLVVSVEYANGKQDGVHQGTTDRDFAPEKIGTSVEELRREVAEAFISAGRQTRAYTVGYARGYREAAL